MRREIRNQSLMLLCALTLVLMVILVQIRLACAADQVLPANPRSPFQIVANDGTPIDVSGSYGSICTRDGEVVFDGSSTKYTPFYSEVANMVNGTHLSTYTLAYHYDEALRPETLSVASGLRNFKANSGAKMTTTLLPGPAQQTIYDAFGEYHGALFAYNFRTGEVYSSVSIPTGQSGNEEDSYLDDRIRNPYASGSTFKIATLVCALSQNPDLKNYTYTCDGNHEVVQGADITCGRAHSGPLTMSDAIGYSCNCYFASLIEQLDVEKTCDILEDLGINTLGKRKEGKIDELVYKKGVSKFASNRSSDQIWKLIGPGSTVSLVDMAKMAGAISNGGSCAVPYIVESIYDPNDEVYTYTAPEADIETLVSPKVAEMLKPMWSNAVDNHYNNRLNPKITLAKTGTSEHTDNKTGDEYNNRLLLGVIEEYDTAFMLVVEHLPSGDTKIMDIANTLLQVLEEAALT